MKKGIALLILSLFINAMLYAQLEQFFPMTSSYVSFNDSVLNTSKLMKKLGVRKVMTYSNAPIGSKKSFLNFTKILNDNGQVEKLIHCMQVLKKDTFFCYDYLTEYDRYGRPEKLYFKGQKGDIYISESIHYPNKNESIITSRSNRNSNETIWDTMTMHKYFKDDGKILKSECYFDSKSFRSVFYHYSSLGLIDSITYKQVPAPTFPTTTVFKRTNKKNNTTIKVIEFPITYEWYYNNNGQCTKLQIITKEYYYVDNIINERIKDKTIVHYTYNEDDTLDKITEKTEGKETLNFYYYYFRL